METWTLSLLAFGIMSVLLILGVPIAFALAGVAIGGTLLTWGPQGLYMIPKTAYAEVTNYIIIAVPLFVLMSNLLQYSGLAEQLYEGVYRWMGGLRGGLAIGTVIICAIFAAMAGISSVATVSMGLIALPSMLKRGYQKEIAIGTISAGGALGILIPPSVIMIIYGSMAEVSIGQLFMGGMIPGILLAFMFCIYIFIRCLINPSLGPPVKERYSWKEKLITLRGLILPTILVLVVLGVIYTGVATPTEAAGIGAFGALICALVYRGLTWKKFQQALVSTTSLTAMVLWIMIGAVCFTHLLAFVGFSDVIKEAITKLPVSKWVVLAGMQFTYFILGMFLDPAGIIMLTTPIFVPIVNTLGFDPVWFGVLFTVNMEMAYLTPPFGFNLFIMKGVVPKGITMDDIYRSIVPFVVLQGLCLILCILFPQLALYLPQKMIGK
jgi:tripartite ATP-independent transporter DctM subunit